MNSQIPLWVFFLNKKKNEGRAARNIAVEYTSIYLQLFLALHRFLAFDRQ